MIRLFNRCAIDTYLADIRKEIDSKISELAEDKLLSTSLEELCDFYCAIYQIDPVVLLKDQMDKNLVSAKIEKRNVWHRQSPEEPEFYRVDGYKLTFSLPFEGREDLLYVQPSTYYMTRFEVDAIERATAYHHGRLIIVLEFTKCQ